MPHERLRIVRIFSRLNVGGPSLHVVLLSAGLDESRFDTTLVVGTTEEREGSFLEVARGRGVAPVVLPTLGRSIRPLDDLKSFWELYHLIRRGRPHIVHTHTAKAGALGRLAARLTGVPIVVHTFHGTVFQGYFGRFGSFVYGWTERMLARWTDTLVAVSPAVASELEVRGLRPRREITTIPLGLELDPFARARATGELRRQLGVPPKAQLVGCVGRLVPIKDVLTLLAALQRSSHPEIHLVVVGDGPERPRLEQRAGELGMKARVHFLGFRSELERIYPELDLVVNSSRNEGTPVALIEAMASGRPVIATRVGGSPDLLEEGALGELVPPGDPEALADAIDRILSQPDRAASRARAARSVVLARYHRDRLLRDMETLYDSLADALLPEREATDLASALHPSREEPKAS